MLSVGRYMSMSISMSTYVLHIVSVMYLTLPYLILPQVLQLLRYNKRIECLGTVRVRVRVR